MAEALQEPDPELVKKYDYLANDVLSEAKFASEGHMGMDTAGNAMLFSEELIEYVLSKLGYNWPCVRGARNLPTDSIRKCFTTIVGDAVVEILAENIESVANSYKDLLSKGVYDVDDFRREICITASMFFPQGYNHGKFLSFSAHLAGLSAFYFADGNDRIADASAQIMSYLINYFIYQLMFRPNGDWFKMCLVAQEIRCFILNNLLTFQLPPYTVPDSPFGEPSN